MDPCFYLFIRLSSAFFCFFCQDTNKTRSNCAVIGCNLSKKHKLMLYKTQNREPNYADHKFFLNFHWELSVQKLGYRHPSTTELASWLVYVLCDFKATWLQEVSVSLKYNMKIHLLIYFTFLVKDLPPSFDRSLSIFIFCHTFY